MGKSDVQCTWETCSVATDGSIEYRPSLAGNIIYLIIFGSLIIAHIFAGVRHRTWGFMALIILGSLGEMVGYAGRIWVRSDPWDMNPFLVYLVPATIAPAFITAAIYLCLGRIITVCGAQHSRIAPRTYTIIFVSFDFLSLVVQSLGGAFASSNDSDTSQLGITIMKAGLILQVVSIVAFLVLWADFAWRAHGAYYGGTSAADERFATIRSSTPFRGFRWALVVSTVLILVRCVYRVAELAGGFDGALANNEPLFMILEGPMIFISIFLLVVYHPGRVFEGMWYEAGWKGARRMGSDDTMEMERGQSPVRK
ncbi:hypothetical protein HKX48_001317 [Thoreauomyces humboldtii]|nr:hypothetical protein HKX48_001317 [Thoreauomyces humboldtii]